MKIAAATAARFATVACGLHRLRPTIPRTTLLLPVGRTPPVAPQPTIVGAKKAMHCYYSRFLLLSVSDIYLLTTNIHRYGNDYPQYLEITNYYLYIEIGFQRLQCNWNTESQILRHDWRYKINDITTRDKQNIETTRRFTLIENQSYRLCIILPTKVFYTFIS